MYYRAEGNAVCADVIPYYENGRFYLFYLKDFRDAAAHGEGCPWCLLTTEDLVHYEEHGEVICRGTAEEQDLYVFTGSCIRRGDEYFIFYTGHNPHMRERGLPVQKILRAKSRDLLHWEKDKEFVLEAPEDFDWDSAMARLATLPRQAEWEAYMAEVQQASAEATSSEKWRQMDRIFNLY